MTWLWSLCGILLLAWLLSPSKRVTTPKVEPRASREDLEAAAKIARKRLFQSRESIHGDDAA